MIPITVCQHFYLKWGMISYVYAHMVLFTAALHLLVATFSGCHIWITLLYINISKHMVLTDKIFT